MIDTVPLSRLLDVVDPAPRPRYHWIEEGSYEDFRRNILESDLPLYVGFFDFSSTGYALMGTVTGRVAAGEPNPCGEVALMGTYDVAPERFHALAEQAQQNRIEVIQNRIEVIVEKANRETIAMLLARPEMA